MSGFLHQRHGPRGPRPEYLMFLSSPLSMEWKGQAQRPGPGALMSKGPCFQDSVTSKLCDLRHVTNHLMLQRPHVVNDTDDSTYHTGRDESRSVRA